MSNGLYQIGLQFCQPMSDNPNQGRVIDLYQIGLQFCQPESGYVNAGRADSPPPAAQLQGRSVSPIRKFEGQSNVRYLIIHDPTREVSRGLFHQEGYELPLPPGKEILEGYTLGRGTLSNLL